ncbi:glycosyltransferase family 39 protein, partial [Patescibacteria group bacterium]|nr:glycosyltransferase family 39 protein [Patescibacteria group bacterium]
AVAVYVAIEMIKAIRTKQFAVKTPELQNPASIALGIFWLIAGVSIIFSKNLQASLLVYAFLTTIVALYIFIQQVVAGDQERVLQLIKAYILIAFVLSLVGFVQLYVYQNYQFIFGAFWNVPGHTPRIGSLFWDVNHFAGLLVLLLPVMAALVLTGRGRQRVAFGIMGFSCVATLILTNARSGWIAGGVAFLVFALILIFRRFRYRGLTTIFALLLIGSGVLLTQYLNKQSPIRREIRQYFHYRLDSFDSHFLLLTGSWQVFEQYPILGGGYGSFYEHFSKTKISATFFSRDPAALNTRVPAHSIWGEALAETGVLGFSALLVIYASVIFTLLYASLRLSRPKEFVISAAMAGSVIGILTAGIFYSYNSEFFWLILFLYFSYALFCLRQQFGDAVGRLWSAIFAHFISNPKFPVLLLTGLSLWLLFFNLGKNHLIPYDEAIYAKVSQNILNGHDWLTLTWAGDSPWFEKPPLYFWLSAFSMQLFPGSPELAVRLPSAIFGFLSVLLVYAFGKKLFGKTAGFIAGFCLLTTFHFLYYARLGMLDVTCSFFILLSLVLYYSAIKEVSLKKLILAGVAIGLAVLTKGVVGLIPLAIVGLYEAFGLVGQKISPATLMRPAAKVVILFLTAAVIFLPWHWAMYQLHGRAFLDTYFGYHVLNRATLETEDKTGPIYWYIVVLKVSMRLWFGALIPAFVYVIFRVFRQQDDRRKLGFILLWALGVFALFSWSKSKLVWYIMPIYPALALMVGYFYATVLDWLDQKLSPAKYISSFFLKAAAVYITICVVLLYLLVNKNLVYVSDLTGSQVQMMQAKNAAYKSNKKVYLDRIELPLALFYVEGPFEVTDFTPLKKAITVAAQEGTQLIFITKESRFKQFQKEFPAIKYIASAKEWYLGELVAP